nr:DUF1974 domain-containing protein [Propionibacterium sp.]
MKTSHRIAVAAGTAAIGLAGAIGVATLAQADATASPTTQPSAGTTAQAGMPGGHGRMGARHAAPEGRLAEQLADKLGLETDTVAKAIDTVRASLRPTEKPTTRPDPAERQDAFAEALATELGVDKAKVTEALDAIRADADAGRKAAFDERLQKAVTEGTLTQAEADAVKKAAEAGVIGYGGRR